MGKSVEPGNRKRITKEFTDIVDMFDDYQHEVLMVAWRMGGLIGARALCKQEEWDFTDGVLIRAANLLGWRKEKRYVYISKYPDRAYDIIRENYSVHGGVACRRMIEDELGIVMGKSTCGGIAYKMGLRSPMLHKANKGSIKKGNVPTNKGKIMSPSAYAKCRATMFKKGQQPHNTHYDGAVRTRKDRQGRIYLYLRIRKRKWVELHRWAYTTFVGKVPKNHVVLFNGGEEHIWHPLNDRLRELEPDKKGQWVLDSIDPLEMLPYLHCISMLENDQRNRNDEKRKETLQRLTDAYIIGRHYKRPEYQLLLKHSPKLLELERMKMHAKRLLKQKH